MIHSTNAGLSRPPTASLSGQARRRDCARLPAFQSRARGVGNSAPGDDEHAPPAVWCAGMDSTHHEWPALVVERRQIGDDPVRAAASQAKDVLSDHPIRAALADDSRHLGPQFAAGAEQPGPASGEADVLARETAAHEDGTQPARAELPDVWVDRDAGPVPGDDRAAARVDLAERDGAEPGPLEAEAEAADTAEEVKDWSLRAHEQPGIFSYLPSQEICRAAVLRRIRLMRASSRPFCSRDDHHRSLPPTAVGLAGLNGGRPPLPV